jgi:cell division protein ZipA
MDRLRLILLVAGVLLIAGIFVWELFRKRAWTRRRAQLVEHLAEEERLPAIGESVLGDIGQADPCEFVGRKQGRRSLDREAPVGYAGHHGQDSEEAVALDGYDIDEDFPGEPSEDITETSPAAAMVAAPEGDARAGADRVLAPLSGLAARRDGPEQLDLAGLEISALVRGSDPGAEGRGGELEPRDESRKRPAVDSGEELHIVMTVMARSGERFSGEALRHALESADLHHGDMNIFHRHALPGDRHSATLFSAANVLAPGDFDPAHMDTLSSPGVAMFMRLPGPESPADAFQQMLDAATAVAEDLDGLLCDETRSHLTPQSINHLRERIADFARRQLLKA